MASILWPNGSTTRPAISSGFGPRNLDNPLASKYHRGVDMYGFGTVHAIADGEVVYVGWYSGVGWSTVAGFMVIVQHDGFFSRSLHTDAGTERVSVGQHVKAGDPLVDMGWSGLQGPWAEHVHLEVTPGQWHNANNGQVDPVPFIEARLGQTGGGGIVADIGGNMEAYLLHENGNVFYVRPGLKKKFTSVDDYNAWRETVNGLRRKKQTSMMRVPFITSLKVLSDWRFDAIVDGIV